MLPSSPDFNPFDSAIWGILENKINAIQILFCLKLQMMRNGISEKFILKTSKSF